MEPTAPLTRRTVLAAAGGAAAAAFVGPGTAAAKASPRAITMAMHIHGPFSEGIASYEAHLEQARRHDVDVVWWTDHDFRVAAHDHRTAVRFEGASEPEDGLAWTWTRSTQGVLASSTAEFVTEPRSPDESGKALRLAATGTGTLWYAGSAWNATANSCIADTELEFDTLPERTGPDAVLRLELTLSHHPTRNGRPAGIYRVHYQFGGVTEPTWLANGLIGTVRLPVTAGAWQRFTVVPVDDVRRLWPDLVAEDNALTGLRFGVTGASYVLDRLRFVRHRRDTPATAEALRADVLAKYAEEYGDVANYRAFEVSLVRHLNWYGGDSTMPAFPSPPLRDNDVALTESMVRFLHGHGGLVCWNHPMDVEKRESLAKLMIQRGALGVDLVEIGRHPLEELLWVFDVAARNALFFTAVGSSDDHDGVDWPTAEEHQVTGVWATSTDRSELLAALRKGAAWFTDLARYRGNLDIRIGSAGYMGAVVVTRTGTVKLSLVATGLPKGSTLEVVTGVVDEAGTGKLAPATTVKKVPATSVSGGKYTFSVKPATGRYVRTQVRTADRAIVGVSNPLWLLPKKPRRAIPSERKRSLP